MAFPVPCPSEPPSQPYRNETEFGTQYDVLRGDPRCLFIVPEIPDPRAMSFGPGPRDVFSKCTTANNHKGLSIGPILLTGFITTLATLAAWPVTRDSRFFHPFLPSCTADAMGNLFLFCRVRELVRKKTTGDTPLPCSRYRVTTRTLALTHFTRVRHGPFHNVRLRSSLGLESAKIPESYTSASLKSFLTFLYFYFI